MRTAQLANPKPLRKKIPSTASRAAHKERSVIVPYLTASIPREGSSPGLRRHGASSVKERSPIPLARHLLFLTHQEQRDERSDHGETRCR
jgi:hypothetical protein